MNNTILSDIENAKKIYPFVLKKIRKFSLTMSTDSFRDLQKRQVVLIKKLREITGKDISIINLYIDELHEYYEQDIQNCSFNISIPEPKIIENITKEELSEIYEIVKNENYRSVAKDYFEYVFFREFNDYFQRLLEINLQYLLKNV